MEVTVTIPDQFAKRLIPAGKDASRVLLEELVESAYGDGRIDAEEVQEILGPAVEGQSNGSSPENESIEDFLERYPAGRTPEWINDPEQVRVHAAAAKFIGCIEGSNPGLASNVSKP
jgi:hypothetical protein